MTAKRDESMDIGVIFGELETPVNCSCHISPPCAACIRNREPVDEACSWSLVVDDDDEDRYIRYVVHSQYAALEALAASQSASLAAVSTELGMTKNSMLALREFVSRIAEDDFDEFGSNLIYEARDLIAKVTQ